MLLSLLGTGVAFYHLCQLHLVVKAQQPDPMLGSILDVCNLLTGVAVDDLTGRDTNMLDQLHLCLWDPKGGGEEAPEPAGPTEAKEAQMRGKVIAVPGEVHKMWASLLDNRYTKISTHAGSPLTGRAAVYRCVGGLLHNPREGGVPFREYMVDLYVYYEFLTVKHLALTKSVYLFTTIKCLKEGIHFLIHTKALYRFMVALKTGF